MPPLMAGALERRAATPLTLSLSEKIAICVSVVACTSRAVGGTMIRCYVGGESKWMTAKSFEYGDLEKMWNVGGKGRKDNSNP